MAFAGRVPWADRLLYLERGCNLAPALQLCEGCPVRSECAQARAAPTSLRSGPRRDPDCSHEQLRNAVIFPVVHLVEQLRDNVAVQSLLVFVGRCERVLKEVCGVH
jgi:hypothetical protein